MKRKGLKRKEKRVRKQIKAQSRKRALILD